MGDGHQPTYALQTIQSLVNEGKFFIRESALTGAFALGFDRYDIVSCILEMDEGDFHKTMPSQKVAGLMQDVYKPVYLGQRLYVKVQLNLMGTAVVISFKEA